MDIELIAPTIDWPNIASPTFFSAITRIHTPNADNI